MESGARTDPDSSPWRWQRVIRWLVMALLFFATSTTVYRSTSQWMNDQEIATSFPALYLGMLVDQQVNSLPRRTRGSRVRIGFLGDSTVEGYPEGLDVATQTGLALTRDAPGQFEVISFAQPGMGPLEYYALAESFVKSDSDIFVISFNIASLSPQARDFWARRALVGWIAPSRILEASRMPLVWWGITIDRMLLYVAGIQANLLSPWFDYRATQLRAGSAVKVIRRRVQGIEADWVSSLPPLPVADHPTLANRFAKPAVLQNLGDANQGAEVDHPVFDLLGGAIDIFRANGIEVCVYATPTNVEHMERVGIDTRDGIGTTIKNLERVALSHDARFLDLHRIFPDEAFRDPGNHLTFEGNILGPQELGMRVADWLVEQCSTGIPSHAGD